MNSKEEKGWGVDGREKKSIFGKACLAEKGRHWWSVNRDEIKVITEWIGGCGGRQWSCMDDMERTVMVQCRWSLKESNSGLWMAWQG